MEIMRYLSGVLLITVCAAVCLAGTPEEGTGPVSSPAPAADQPYFKPFYVYTDDSAQQSHFAASGWMGDTQDLRFSGAKQDLSELGNTCLRVRYLAKGTKEWAGVYWQNPANNWGNVKGGYDLRGAVAVTFWARGDKGGEKINEVKIGGITGKISDSDVAWIGPLKLKNTWKQYRIDLKGKDLRYINGGFCFTILKSDNPQGCTFYMDEIRYE